MGRYIATRILTACLTIWGVATIVFVLMHLIPGGIVEALAGPAVAQRPELVARIMEKYGLDQPLIVQYGLWLGNALRGDLGESLASRSSVSSE
ncbi:MAG: ABC transporter permease, partial [Chloroflexia bacterium]|nr:ABC transporter permease [Chloroflexia bacterium]